MSKKVTLINKLSIDYKNIKLLKQLISRYGKIVPRQYTKVSLKDQKKVATAIKNARFMGLLPFIK